ncbi:hypothetical protein RF11_03876 [Thelohanellus kitauei]|uniref:Uncharacterized protein n=1 Tax=Thelohanellus kitauei TaxID=669202 RepID=A0A0C2IGL7_THEKT|nr:hypothetical protein RF11_03876 [Thelohanellus kitauei]
MSYQERYIESRKKYGRKCTTLARKRLHFLGICDYEISMKEDHRRKFITIAGFNEPSTEKEIVINIENLKSFINKLNWVFMFGKKYEHNSSQKQENGTPAVVFKDEICTVEGRFYTFELIKKPEALEFCLKHSFLGSETSLMIELEYLKTLVRIIENFKNEYWSNEPEGKLVPLGS